MRRCFILGLAGCLAVLLTKITQYYLPQSIMKVMIIIAIPFVVGFASGKIIVALEKRKHKDD